MSDDIGDTSAPARYMATGREAIDIIREELGDPGFVAFCLGCSRKYELRAGHKGDAATDLAKAQWYLAMARHVMLGTPDPRTYRTKT